MSRVALILKRLVYRYRNADRVSAFVSAFWDAELFSYLASRAKLD